MTTSQRTGGRPPNRFDDLAANYVPEDLILQTARGLAHEVGLDPLDSTAGATLRLLANVSSARAVVEIGTGTGVSGLWLLRGMRPDGVLTTIDLEAEHQRMARRLFAEAGFPAARTRVIAGRALEVLPRLTDGVYDLVFADIVAEVAGDADAYVAQAARLLRPGGLLVLHRVRATAGWQAALAIRDSEHWLPALLPAGTAGLLAAARQGG